MPVGSERWAEATANAFGMLKMEECAEVAKPEWWNDEELKSLSARVVRAAPNHGPANFMRAWVLGAMRWPWEAGPRSAAEFREAAAHFDRSAALSDAPALTADYTDAAELCLRMAEII